MSSFETFRPTALSNAIRMGYRQNMTGKPSPLLKTGTKNSTGSIVFTPSVSLRSEIITAPLSQVRVTSLNEGKISFNLGLSLAHEMFMFKN